MSISKAVIMGKVVRNPEKRFTTNNIAITYFAIDISKDEDPSVVKVIAKGKLAEITADTVKKDKIVIVEGRLQTNVTKTASGVEKKGVEIDAQAVEIVGEVTDVVASSNTVSDDFSFSDDIATDDLIGEDEIPF